jgi:hypothetical protein
LQLSCSCRTVCVVRGCPAGDSVLCNDNSVLCGQSSSPDDDEKNKSGFWGANLLLMREDSDSLQVDKGDGRERVDMCVEVWGLMFRVCAAGWCLRPPCSCGDV